MATTNKTNQTTTRRNNASINITSTLEKIATQVFKAETLDDAKRIFTEHVADTKINEADKMKMMRDVNVLTNLNSVHRYLANSLLKYEGLGVTTSANKQKYGQISEDIAENSADL